MKNYKCILFDCDGVLVDSEILGTQVMVDMANAHGANINLEFALKNFKGSFLKECISQIETILGSPLPSTFEKEYRERSFDAFKNDLKAVKGVKEVLQALTIPFCVASSGPKEKIKLNLTLTGLAPYFEANIFSCYDINLWKPNPAIFLHAAEQMGFKPEECLVIEDSLAGVRAAKNGGFDVFGYAELDDKNELEKEATLVFYNMKELLPFIF
ncbi:MAG: HAD family hydrolase [Cellulophaga sp.]